MELQLKPGKYLLAVSGGVDSIVLLDILNKRSDLQLVVAHFDHGIRKDSNLDREFVEQLASKYGLDFYFEEGRLGSKTSEALARTKRYDFLTRIKEKTNSSAIITAHHQDDLLETAVINWLRGTGRRGLNSLKSTDIIKRPLLNVPKQELIDYANKNNLSWREDSTNKDERYLRNYVRHQIIANLSKKQREELLNIIEKAKKTNQVIEKELEKVLVQKSNNVYLDRQWFISLPHSVSKEVLAAWLRQHQLYSLDRPRLEQLAVDIKINHPGKQLDINKQYILKLNQRYLALEPRDR